MGVPRQQDYCREDEHPATGPSQLFEYRDRLLPTTTIVRCHLWHTDTNAPSETPADVPPGRINVALRTAVIGAAIVPHLREGWVGPYFPGGPFPGGGPLPGPEPVLAKAGAALRVRITGAT